jgi:hypothetical protein
MFCDVLQLEDPEVRYRNDHDKSPRSHARTWCHLGARVPRPAGRPSGAADRGAGRLAPSFQVGNLRALLGRHVIVIAAQAAPFPWRIGRRMPSGQLAKGRGPPFDWENCHGPLPDSGAPGPRLT